jgi:CheY-like chemotaxis protein
VIVNLIGNAIKFTAEGDVRLEVAQVSRDDGAIGLQFTVSDTGIGIPKHKQGAIFEAFAQADNSTTRKYGGTGLGLSISSRLVQLMSGKIWVESKAKQGSVFHFTARFGLQKQQAKIEYLQGGGSNSALLASRRPVRDGKQELRILLVEDNAINQILAQRLIRKRGHNLVVANNGREALAALENERFDLILMDIQMPEMSGLEVTAAIRLKERTTGEHIPIVATTASAMKEDRERCLAAGMDAYLSKPIRAQELIQAVESFQKVETAQPQA